MPEILLISLFLCFLLCFMSVAEWQSFLCFAFNSWLSWSVELLSRFVAFWKQSRLAKDETAFSHSDGLGNERWGSREEDGRLVRRLCRPLFRWVRWRGESLGTTGGTGADKHLHPEVSSRIDALRTHDSVIPLMCHNLLPVVISIIAQQMNLKIFCLTFAVDAEIILIFFVVWSLCFSIFYSGFAIFAVWD